MLNAHAKFWKKIEHAIQGKYRTRERRPSGISVQEHNGNITEIVKCQRIIKTENPLLQTSK